MKPFCRAGLMLLAFAVAAVAPLAAGEAAAPDPAQEKIRAAVAKVYDTSVLHHIDIVIAAKDVRSVERRTDTRVPCTFTFDGVTLTDVGVRQAGGIAHPYLSIGDKPSLSIKFNEFTKGQKLHGIDKLVLKNELQDMSFVNEHLTYEVFRRAGLAAPATAHAVVTINGKLNGIYLMREPINKEFLVRNFGSANATGNLYEVELQAADFVGNPRSISLKDEVDEHRDRADLVATAAAIRAAKSANFIETVGAHVDLPRYLTYMAVEGVTSYFDGFSFHSNNTYLYMNPKDGKMIVIPSGADETIFGGTAPVTRMRSASQPPGNPFTRAFRSVPGVEAAFQDEIERVSRPPIWDQKYLLDRVARVAAIFATAERTGRTATDLRRFESYRRDVEKFIKAGGTNGM